MSLLSRATTLACFCILLSASATMAEPVSDQASAPATQTPAGIKPEYAAVFATLTERFPEYPVDKIIPSPIAGLLEVDSGHHVFYVDPSGKYVLNGHVFDLVAREDITKARMEDLSRVDPKELPIADAFDIVRGNGKRQVYIFSDPDCPYCRKLEQQIPSVSDVTIHVFLYPLTSLHPNAYDHALGVWCSKDRQKSWSNEMLKGVDPAAAKCDNPLERNLALGEKLGVNATPTMVFADGRMHAGVVSATEFERLLNGSN